MTAMSPTRLSNPVPARSMGKLRTRRPQNSAIINQMDDRDSQDPPPKPRPEARNVDDEYRELKHELKDFDEHVVHTEQDEESEERREDFGQEPVRPWSWETHKGGDPDQH